jgi:hypothetical protein
MLMPHPPIGPGVTMHPNTAPNHRRDRHHTATAARTMATMFVYSDPMPDTP